MSNRARVSLAAAAVGLLSLIAYGIAGDGVDHSVPARSGGTAYVDIELGSGVSFEKGSLEITTHEKDEVLVSADISGWGEYAVDIDVTEQGGDVRVIGRVDGMLHWMFGGPTIDVRVVVPQDPQDFTVDARIDDGPLLLEDLSGGVNARVAGSEITLRRAEGDVKLSSEDSEIHVEDVDGSLEIDSERSDVQVTGLRGHLIVRTEHGSVQVTSATGRVDVATPRGNIRLERVHGNVFARADRGRIEAEQIDGDVEVRTERGRIEVHELDGAIEAHSNRGGISVSFARAPSGVIETERGSIELEVPVLVGFDLDAQTARGDIEFDDRLAFQPSPASLEAQVAAGPTRAEKIEQIREVGMQIAAEVQAKVLDRVHTEMERVRREMEERRRANPDAPAPEAWPWTGEDAPFEWNPEQWGWHDRDWDSKDWSWNAGKWGLRKGSHLQGSVNGGGKELRVRTDRGDIRIEEG